MHQGTGASSVFLSEATGARGATGLKDQGQEDRSDMEALRDLEDTLKAQTGESALDDQINKHVITRLTDEGLVVEIFDRPQRPLFRKMDEPTELLLALVSMISDSSRVVTNTVAIEAHVAADPLVRIAPKAWPHSMRRGEKARDLFLDAGLSKERIARITGHGDQEPVVRNKMAPRNNRLEIIFLRE